MAAAVAYRRNLMIRSFKDRALRDFWHKDDASGIRADQVERVRKRLDALRLATRPQDLNLPGFNLHRLRGAPVRYTIHVNGPWCIAFGWDGEDAVHVDFKQYH